MFEKSCFFLARRKHISFDLSFLIDTVVDRRHSVGGNVLYDVRTSAREREKFLSLFPLNDRCLTTKGTLVEIYDILFHRSIEKVKKKIKEMRKRYDYMFSKDR